MQAIVAADNNWGIGYQNRLLVSIPSDMKFFRQKTTGNVVVMGRKTLESFPNGLPLKNRVNIVLTKNKNYQVKDAVIVHSEEELLEELKKYPSEKIYVIGGESIYKMMLPYCDIVYVTKISKLSEMDSGVENRYAGVVEPQETVQVKIESGRKVKEVQVKTGQEVKKGQLLFQYDLRSIQQSLQEAQLALDRLKTNS